MGIDVVVMVALVCKCGAKDCFGFVEPGTGAA